MHNLTLSNSKIILRPNEDASRMQPSPIPLAALKRAGAGENFVMEGLRMSPDELKALQAPIKERYRGDPEAAVVTLRAEGELGSEEIACSVETGRALVAAGLHPASGGSGGLACSGDTLLQALVACAGVTLKAVATTLEFRLAGGRVLAEGDLDFRGTLGVAKDAPVGFKAIRLEFDLDTDEPPERIATLQKLTERYCVVMQTLRTPPEVVLQVNAG